MVYFFLRWLVYFVCFVKDLWLSVVLSMPKEVLISLISRNQYHYIILNGLCYLFVWFWFIKLAMRLNKISIRWQKIILWCFPAAIYSLIGKVFLPQKFFGFISMLVAFILVSFVGKLTLKKTLLTTIIMFFLTFLGPIVVEPVIRFNENLYIYLFHDPSGLIIGGLIEGFFPFMFSIILKYYDFELSKKIRDSELLGIVILGVLFLAMCSLMSQYICLIVDSTNDYFFYSFILQLFLITTAILAFILKHQSLKREEKDRLWEQLHQQLEQSSALIRLLAGEQREFRNKLQVLRGMVDLGKCQEAVRYIDRVNSEMINTKAIDFDNPILGSALLEQIVQGRELGVEIKIENGSSLKEMYNSFKIGKALKLALNYFLNNPALKKENPRVVVVTIEKGVDKYQFSIFCHKKQQQHQIRQVELCEDDDQNLKEAEAIIKELDGRFSYGYLREVLTRFSFEIPATAQGL